MAAAINLNATTVEGQLIELITAMQVMESDETRNPEGRNLVTGSTNLDNGNFQGSFNISITPSVASDGSIKIEAQQYLT